MDFRYQAAIARALGQFVEQGLVYKGKKPVHWCIHCRTALAEAEVEYEDHASPSIYVEFPLRRRARERARRTCAGARRAPRFGPHLDDDALDDPVEPGDRLPPRFDYARLRGRTAAPSSSRKRSHPLSPTRSGRRLARRSRGCKGARARTPPLPAPALRRATRSACSATT